MEDLVKVAGLHVCTPEDVKDFNEALKGWIGAKYIPILARDLDVKIIGVDKKQFICTGHAVVPNAKNGLYVITISRAVYPGAKWKVNKIVKLPLPKSVATKITISALTQGDKNEFGTKYPQMLGVTKTPLAVVLFGEPIGGKRFFLVRFVISDQERTSGFELLEY